MQWPPLRTLSRRTAPAHPRELLPPIMEVPVPACDATATTSRDQDLVRATVPAPVTRSDDVDAASARGYLPPVEMAAPALDPHGQLPDTAKKLAGKDLQQETVVKEPARDKEPHQQPVIDDPEPKTDHDSTFNPNPADQRASSPSSSSADSGINHSDVDDVDPYYWDVAAVDENIDAYYCYDTHAHTSTPAPHVARAAVPNDDPYAWPPRAYNFNAVWRAAAAAAKPAPAPIPVPAPVAREQTAVVVDVHDEPIAAPAAASAAPEVVDKDAGVADAVDMWKLVCQHYAVASALDARPSTAAAAAARVR
ncbi:hypothetical protein GGF32_003143 [Allomyces javanicus]|nr:hypothetical protein GGF32_003143 [Allomyces javanicus]